MMKKNLILAAAFLVTVAVQAQDEQVKDIYVQNGDQIEATLHFDNGAISQTGFFTKDGKLTGKWTSYNREGIKTAEAQYDQGQKVGTWFFWSGDQLTEVDYSNSRIAEVNTWKSEESRVVSNK